MNDRAQGGSADVATPNSIELMQNRRSVSDDDHGVNEALNDRDFNDVGLAVNAKYYMQIFNTKKGKSLQRSHQINIEQPFQYFFIFDYTQSQAPALVETQFESLIQIDSE